MIVVDDVPILSLSSEATHAFDPMRMSEEEWTALDAFDAMIEEAVESNRDQMFEVEVPEWVSLNVLGMLKWKWEIGKWIVGAFALERPYRLVFVRPTEIKTENAKVEKDKQVDARPVDMSNRQAEIKRLLVRMPTRGRPTRALLVLEKYRTMADYPLSIEVVIDVDDETMQASDVLQRLRALDCVVTVGAHANKIAAVNGGRVRDWDILLLASDDMVPVVDGYGHQVVQAMEEKFPFLDGLVYFDDGYAHERCVTLPIFGRRLYEMFGYVYEPSYTSLCCDVEQTELLSAMGRIAYMPRMIIEHQHPATGRYKMDDLYQENEKHHDADAQTYRRRKAMARPHARFAFDAPPLWLSICIATVAERRMSLERLLDYLYAQAARYPREVEILVDSGAGTIGEKRQRLLDRARGNFISYVDDDDWVSHDYVSEIVTAARKNPDADCMSLVGRITIDGGAPTKFHHSVHNKSWCTGDDGVYLRWPNHLNAVRIDHAKAAGFPSVFHGEDYEYSKRLLGRLKREVEIDRVLYHYWNLTKKERA